MAGLQSSNPVFGRSPSLKAPTFDAPGYPTPGEVEDIYRTPQRMTLDDVVMKTGILLGIVVVAGAFAWIADLSMGVIMIAAVVGFVLAMVNIFKRQVSPGLVLAYAACEGVFLGGLSKFFETTPGYEGLPLQAAVGTATIFGAVLFAYKNKVLRATPKFTKIVTGAFIGLFALLILNFVIGMFDGGGTGLGLRDRKSVV